MAGPTIEVEYRANTKPMEKGVKQAAQTASSSVKGVGTIAAGVFGGAVMAKAAGAAKDYFTGAVKGAMDAEVANTRFATTLKNIANATPAQVKQAQDFIGAMSKQGAVAKGELRPAFETLLRGTHNVTAAQGALKTAMDISAGTGKPLAVVAQAMTRGYLGNVGAMGRLGLQVKKTVPDLAALKRAQEGQAKALKDYADAVKKHGAGSEQAKKAQDRLASATLKVKDAQDKTKGATLTMKEVMAKANDTFGGQAQKQAQTTAGKMKNMQLQMKALQVTVGQDLMPIISNLAALFTSTLLPVLQTVADLFKKYPGVMQGVAAAVLAAIVALKLYSLYQKENVVVTGLVTAAQWLWNAAVAANPIVLLVIAIVALVAIIVALLVKFGILQKVASVVWQALQTAFHAIVAAGQWLWNWFASNWPTLLAILAGPIGIAVLLIVRNWDKLKAAASAVWDFLKMVFDKVVGFFAGIPGRLAGVFNAIVSILKLPIQAAQAVWSFVTDKFNALVGFISGLAGRIGGGISSMVGAIKAPINALIGVWNSLEFRIPSFTLPSFDTHIPGIGKIGGQTFGGATFGFPDLPKLATGGVTRTEGLAWLHPAEVITPLSAAPQITREGPAVNIEHAEFSEALDVDLFMARVAWTMRTRLT